MSLKKSDTLPIPLTNTSQEYGGLPRNRCSANLLADSLGKSPAYQQRDSERWNAAINRYQEFLSSNRGQCCTSPPNSPVDESGIFSRLNISGGGLAVVNGSSLEAIPPRRESISSLPSLSMVSSINRSMHGVDSRGESSLELEAIAAVHELSYAVQSISVSEMLPRTPDLIFVNVTTLEAQPYCLELTLKGWRICSLRHDCMTGDFTRLDLFTKYFDSLKSLMEEISASYHDLSFERLEQKLRLILDNGEDNNGILAPASSYAGTPVLCHSPRSHSRNMLATATLRTSCASTN